MFIGQGSGGQKKGGGMPQKEQKAVLAAFRAGAFNTLVATCIAEEGLDIPQVSCSPPDAQADTPGLIVIEHACPMHADNSQSLRIPSVRPGPDADVNAAQGSPCMPM